MPIYQDKPQMEMVLTARLAKSGKFFLKNIWVDSEIQIKVLGGCALIISGKGVICLKSVHSSFVLVGASLCVNLANLGVEVGCSNVINQIVDQNLTA